MGGGTIQPTVQRKVVHEREKTRRPSRRHKAPISLMAFRFVRRKITKNQSSVKGAVREQTRRQNQLGKFPQPIETSPEPLHSKRAASDSQPTQDKIPHYFIVSRCLHQSFMPRIWITARTFLHDSPHELIINVPGTKSGWAFISTAQVWWWIVLYTGCIISSFLHKSVPSAGILRNVFLWSLALFSNFPGGHIAQARWTDLFLVPAGEVLSDKILSRPTWTEMQYYLWGGWGRLLYRQPWRWAGVRGPPSHLNLPESVPQMDVLRRWTSTITWRIMGHDVSVESPSYGIKSPMFLSEAICL